jgi:hypothetical protein
MPFFDQNRDALRARYVEAWRKRRARLPEEPLEMQIADVIEEHPEYQAAFAAADDLVQSEFPPQAGRTNPFLHLGLHLAVRDQVATDRPFVIWWAFERLVARSVSRHDAEHAMIERLAEALWEAQRAGRPPDEHTYLENIERLARG